MIRKWRCTVCGYIHQGDAPPESCPVCHAPAEKFELVAEEQQSRSLFAMVQRELQQLRENFVAHAVFAHFPVALTSTSFLFLMLFLFRGNEALEFSIFALLLVVGVSAPLTFVSGLRDWKKHYQGKRAAIFIKKVWLGRCLLLLLAVALFWRWQVPAVLTDGGLSAGVFLLLHLLMLGCVTLLGHYGGILVFGDREKRK